MTPERIEAWRQAWATVDSDVPELRRAADEKRELCELALDGLRFRIWCEGASSFSKPGICELAKLLTYCHTPQQYRDAIDQFIIMRHKAAA